MEAQIKYFRFHNEKHRLRDMVLVAATVGLLERE